MAINGVVDECTAWLHALPLLMDELILLRALATSAEEYRLGARHANESAADARDRLQAEMAWALDLFKAREKYKI